MHTFNFAVRKAATFAALALCAILFCACNQNQNTSSEGTPVLSRAPNTTYPMPPLRADAEAGALGWTLHDGDRSRLSDYRGKILVLDFYATWCAPCRESIPQLVALQHRFATQGLQVVGLNVGGPDDRVKVAAFAGEFKVDYPLGFPDKAMIDLFLSDDESIPQTFVFDRKGQLLKRFIGYDPSLPKQMEETIQPALTQKPD
jgi:cytochrome c biogenesis protein CcmG/thiol:disulfide interchange protein DsbE